MATALKTSTSDLEDNKVRIEVEVPPETVEEELNSTATQLGREMRIPGFRKGKVPAQMVIRQLGRETVLDEAVRSALPGWYERAVTDAKVAAIGDPKLDLADLPEKGAPLAFSIEVAVRPKAKLGDYKNLEVGRREPEASDEEIDEELERMREQAATLETVEREAKDGDFVVLDFVGTVDGEPFEGGEARGYLLELGSGRLIPGFEEQLGGAKAGDERQGKVDFPAGYPAENLAGKEAEFAVSVKEVKEKRLPELGDEFAVQAGGFDTLDELRGDIEDRLREADERGIEAEFREAAVDAAAAEAKVEIPHELVHSKAHEMWHRTSRRLAQQGVDPQRYLELTGKTEEELVTEAEPEAETALRREAVLAAVVKQEAIEVSDEEVTEALRAAATAEGGQPPSDKQLQRSLKRLKSQGADESLREDIALRKAVDLIVESAKPIPVDQAKAREKLWTPDKEEKEAAGAGQIWTPGSD